MKKIAFYILIAFVYSINPAFSQWEECNDGLYNKIIIVNKKKQIWPK